MTHSFLEHANVTVTDVDQTLDFLITALPGWTLRGEGRMDWFGKTIRWLHVGTDDHYIALQSGGKGVGLDWQSHAVGVKHLGLVVPDVDAVVQRLQAVGHALDHWGGTHPHRRSVYFQVGSDFQVEFVEYLSDLPAERNHYPEM